MMRWRLVIFLVPLVAVNCMPFHGNRTNPKSATMPSFTPNAANDKVILVKGWNELEIRKILADFIETYKNDNYPSYTIGNHKQSDNVFRLTFPQDIHPLLFTFLVNYLAYPFDFDLKNRSITVGGKTTLDSAFEGIEPSLAGNKAILYIPENDEDHDVVYMQTESGINLANSFSELKWRRVKDARLPSEVKNLINGN